ncbi:MAG: hypothetical protein M1825_005313 [Sarcosagium campestre]|nr:MAG: hypothetical protein M1825_005313 [Sarcosagium campestre]
MADSASLDHQNAHSSNGALSQGAQDLQPGQQPPLSPAQDGLDRAVDSVVQSDIGVSTLLNRLKQSIASAKDFAGFLKKRSSIEEEHAQGLKKLCRTSSEGIRRPDNRQGSYLLQFDEVTRIHERMAENGVQFALSLHQMNEDLVEMTNTVERGRKHWKQSGLNAEKRVQDAQALLDKAKLRYDGLAEEYDRARAGDRQAGKKFGLKGPKSAAQHEEDVQRKLQAADSDYASKVQSAQGLRQELVSSLRPQAVQALNDLIHECDSALTLQLQKFASFNERLLLNNGLCISPLNTADGQGPQQGKSLREVIRQIDNEKDLKQYLASYGSKAPPRPTEIKYEKHPTLAPHQQTPAPQMNKQYGAPSSHHPQPLQQQPPHQQAPPVFPTQQGPMSGQLPPSLPQSQSQQPYYQQQQQQQHNMHNQPLPQQPPQQGYPPQGYGPPPHLGGGPPDGDFNGATRGPAQPPFLQGGPQSTPSPTTTSSGPPQLPPSQFGGPSLQQQAHQHQPSTPQPPSQSQPLPAPGASGDLPPLKPVFGVSLQQLFDRDESAVPLIVYQCLQAIDLYGLEVEGIYRLSGTATHIQHIKAVFDNDASRVDFRNPEHFFHDVNSVAGVLKQFFRDLPDPLLTTEYYPALIEAARIDDDIIRRDSLHAVINNLPDPNYATLRALALHLHRVQQHSSTNRMNAGNLAICLGPTLMGSNTGPNIADAGFQVRVIDTILKNTYQIFEDD